ncbi:hypothetical protein TNCV_2373011 [Trichonephila clavipes]|nr:hypothetical protein TNCV_2373011 [Trichonephila clavipes]
MESEDENEETKLNRSDFAHYVGTPIDTNLREQIFKLDPCQPEAKSLENDVLSFLNTLDINLVKCQGQGYYGATNLSGAYGGLQKLIKDKQPKADHVHCSAHNPNLVLNAASKNVPHLREFYDFCQKIYTVFGQSLKRWSDLKIVQNNEDIQLTIKSLCTIRWSSRFDSVISIRYNYSSILKVL